MMMEEMGGLAWFDLTVDDAEGVRDFYTSVMGWKYGACDMDGYDDYSMKVPETGEDFTGVCHKRGCNGDMPSQWMLYFTVKDIDSALATVVEKGGKQVTEIKSFGESKYAVIQDPAGAVCALYQV